MVRGLGNVLETLACPNHQTPLREVVKLGAQATLICSGSAAMTTPDPLDLWHQRPRRSTLSFTTTYTYYGSHLQSAAQMVWTCTACHILCNFVTHFPIPGTRGRERPRKEWSEFMTIDDSNCGLAGVDTQDRDAWRTGVRPSLMLPNIECDSDSIQWPLLLTWFNFNPSMDK